MFGTTPEISPADVVMKERYRASRDEVMQTDRWEEMAVRRSLTSTTQFRRFRNTVRFVGGPLSETTIL